MARTTQFFILAQTILQKLRQLSEEQPGVDFCVEGRVWILCSLGTQKHLQGLILRPCLLHLFPVDGSQVSYTNQEYLTSLKSAQPCLWAEEDKSPLSFRTPKIAKQA